MAAGDWGEGPRISGRRTQLLCCWLAWSRFRVVLPAWDQSLGSLTACLDRALRICGGVPADLLTDNPRTVTVDHVAGIPVRHPDMVALGRLRSVVLGPDETPEEADAELAAGDVDGDLIRAIPARTWSAVRHVGLEYALLVAAEAGTTDGPDTSNQRVTPPRLIRILAL